MTHYSKQEIEKILDELSKAESQSCENYKIGGEPYKKLGVDLNFAESGGDDSALNTIYGGSFVCSECKKIYLSSHLLELHILENHDSYFLVARETQPMYSCFLVECELKLKTFEERKEHCINSHSFPHDFRFDHFQQSSAKLNLKQDSINNAMDVDNPTVLTSQQTSQPKKVANFSFGQKCQKTFNAKSSKGKGNPARKATDEMEK